MKFFDVPANFLAATEAPNVGFTPESSLHVSLLLKSHRASTEEKKHRLPWFTPLESPAIYGGDNINKASIPYRKGGVKAPSFLTGYYLYGMGNMGLAVALMKSC